MSAVPALTPDLDTLRRERDLDVMRLEADVSCTCQTRAWSARGGGSVVMLDTLGCWLHDDERRRTHLGVAECLTCQADEVASRLVEGDCRACAPAERWRPVVGADGRYEVSDLGRVRSLANTNGHTRPAPRLCRAYLMSGYPYVGLGKGLGTRAVHRLVLEAFVGPCPEGMVCAHGNGVRTDARLENLRWATPTENEADKRQHRTTMRGEAHVRAKVTWAVVHKMREAYANGASIASLCREYGLTKWPTRAIVLGLNWATCACCARKDGGPIDAGGWCARCVQEAGPARGPFTPELKEF